MSVFKAAAHMRELKQRLQILLPGSVITENLDASDSMPVLDIATGAEHQAIKIYMDDNAGRVDGLGLPQRVYSPHICRLIQESAAAATPAAAQARAKALAAVAKLGMKVIHDSAEDAGAATSWSAAAAAVTADAAHVTTILPSDEINPLTMSQ